MAKVKLNEFVQQKKNASFVFIASEMTQTTSGEKVLIMHLDPANPIAAVTGTQRIPDGKGGMTSLTVYDVVKVKIHETDFGADGIEIDPETNAGEVSTNSLTLDVTNGGEVWLKGTTFAEFRRNQRQERNGNRTAGLLQQMENRKVKKELGGATLTPTPEPVVTENGAGK